MMVSELWCLVLVILILAEVGYFSSQHAMTPAFFNHHTSTTVTSGHIVAHPEFQRFFSCIAIHDTAPSKGRFIPFSHMHQKPTPLKTFHAPNNKPNFRSLSRRWMVACLHIKPCCFLRHGEEEGMRASWWGVAWCMGAWRRRSSQAQQPWGSVEKLLIYGKILCSWEHTWRDLNLVLCLAAISWYKASTASVLESSRYSLYMLWVPDRESYRSQIPKFLTFNGRFSWIWQIINLPSSTPNSRANIPGWHWRSHRWPSWPCGASSRSTRNETLQRQCLVQKFSFCTALALGLPLMADGGRWPGTHWDDLFRKKLALWAWMYKNRSLIVLGMRLWMVRFE